LFRWSKSSLDAQLYALVPKNVDAAKLPHVARWAAHIGFFTAAQQATWRVFEYPKEEVEEAEEEGSEAEGSEEGSDDESGSDDPFGDSDSEDDEEAAAFIAKRAEEVKIIQARQAAKAGKARSNVTLDVKPLGSETDMDDLQEQVKAIEIEGLKWLGGQFLDVAFGIKKLRIMCQIVDALVPSADNIVEAVEELDDLVQSCDVFAFQMA